MIESHIQVLHAGPVQPIGLPPVVTMGVTNARVLHRRMLNKSNHVNNLLGAKRCLFGSPAPGEIQSLYKEEMRRNRERFIQRYNYDILNEKFVEVNGNSEDSEDLQDSSDKCNTHSERIEDRLHEDPSDVDSDSNSVISTFSESDCDKKCNLDSVQFETSTRDDCSTLSTMKTSAPSSPSAKDKRACERLKPYSRQFLITEFYNNRKIVTTSSSTTHAIEVNQLPKPQKAKLRDEQKTLRQCENV